MNRDSKRINPSLRSRIEIVKSAIRGTNNMFDGDGYVFKTALKELKHEGLNIVYDRKAAVYYKEAK